MFKVMNSSKWKTDPRAAYIPPAIFASLFLAICLAVGPAWSFETIEPSSADVHGEYEAITQTHLSSPTVVDPCLPLLKSIHHVSTKSAMDRNQRSAGKAAAVGLVLGVRFALSPPTKVKSRADRPRLDVWHVSSESVNDHSALAVTAYRQCQKEQALKAISEFRWAR